MKPVWIGENYHHLSDLTKVFGYGISGANHHGTMHWITFDRRVTITIMPLMLNAFLFLCL